MMMMEKKKNERERRKKTQQQQIDFWKKYTGKRNRNLKKKSAKVASVYH